MEIIEIGNDYIYNKNALKRNLSPYEIPRDLYAFHHLFGFETGKRNILYFIEKGVILTLAGNVVQLIRVENWTKKFITGLDGAGIGAITVHPSGKYFAVAEKGIKPNIYIYQYPELQVYRILRNGTERQFCSVHFSHNGNKLASLGGKPDYLLTVWDWKHENIILRCKAFGQEVYQVRFSPSDDGFLTTCGSGHIRFWKMASTFTGLKLQGSIGKFGKTEMSDIEAFCVFSDGKVLSSTERGSMLLWDGNFIKCEILLPERKSPHVGEIKVILMDAERNMIITAGDDGFVKWWSLQDIQVADALEDDTVALIAPLSECKVGEHAKITGVLMADDHYIIQDHSGAILKLDRPSNKVETLQVMHGGKINGLASSPTQHFAATVGEDGILACWDYIERNLIFHYRADAPGTAIDWAPTTVDCQGKTVAAGFGDGTLRVFVRGQKRWILVQAQKPHTERITSISYAPSGRFLATASADCKIFFFGLPDHSDILESTVYDPTGFVNTQGGVTSLCWNSDSSRVLVTTNLGEIFDFAVPTFTTNADDRESYQLDAEYRIFPFRRQAFLTLADIENLEKDEEEMKTLRDKVDKKISSGVEPTEYNLLFADSDRTPSPKALCAQYCTDGSNMFMLTVGGQYNGQIYKCSWNNEFPVQTYADSKVDTDFFKISQSKKLFLTGNTAGQIRLRSFKHMDAFAQIQLHDGMANEMSGAAMSFDDKFILTAAGDGLLGVCRVHVPNLLALAEQLDEIKSKKYNQARTMAMAAEARATLENDGQRQSGSAPGTNDPANKKFPSLEGLKVWLSFIDTPFDGEISEEKGDGFLTILDSDQTNEMFPAEKPSPLGLVSDLQGISAASDIIGANIYSIEDVKLKMEIEIKQKVADQKKMSTAEIIESLKQEFLELYNENKAQSPDCQLNSEEFDIDTEYTEILRQEGEAACEEARLEMEYEREKSQLAVQKLKKRYLDDLLVDSITLHAFESGVRAQSYRTVTLSEQLCNRLKLIKAANGAVAAVAGGFNGLNTAGHSARSVFEEPEDQDGKNSVSDANVSQSGTSQHRASETSQDESTASVHGFEARKQLRQQRKEQMDMLLIRKPGQDTEDPRDINAIKQAEDNMGDYKLKTSDDYVVPECERMNKEKKINQMALLEESIQNTKMEFNNKFLEMRELKQNIIVELTNDHKRLDKIDKELALNKEFVQTSLDLNTIPPTYTRNNNEFPEEQRENVAALKNSDSIEYEDENKENPAHSTHMVNDLTTVDEPSQVELAETKLYVLSLEQERLQLVEKMNQTVAEFDKDLLLLRHSKQEWDAIIKSQELKLLIYNQELGLLQNFEETDQMLDTKLKKQMHDKGTISDEIREVEQKVSLRKTERSDLVAQEKELFGAFNSFVQENSPFYSALLKCYRRKIKRPKRSMQNSKQIGEEDSDADFSDDDDDESESDSEDGDSDNSESGKDAKDACPTGCDVLLYDKVLELRERRLDLDDALTECNKAADEQIKIADRLKQKDRQLEKELQATRKELQIFQNEKQQEINQLEGVEVLYLHQISCFEDVQYQNDVVKSYTLPEDVSNCLLIDETKRVGLKNQIDSHLSEYKELRQQFKDLHKEQAKLRKENANKQLMISASNKKCEDLQMLKFGRLIDLDALDKAAVSQNVLDMKKRVRLEELKNERSLNQIKSDGQKLKHSMLEATRTNTELLEKIAVQSKRQFELESELNKVDIEQSISMNNSPQLIKDREERIRLVELVKLQGNEVKALQSEIMMLRNKNSKVVPVPSIKS